MSPKKTPCNFLFVYGTLRRDAHNNPHPLLKHAQFVDYGRVKGRLYEIAAYPGWVKNGNDYLHTVHGELYALPNIAMLDRIDAYEECSTSHPKPHEYQRITESILLDGGCRKQAWIYRYNRPILGRKLIASGDYNSFLRQQR